MAQTVWQQVSVEAVSAVREELDLLVKQLFRDSIMVLRSNNNKQRGMR